MSRLAYIRKNKDRGFTLVETIVTLILLSVVVIASVGILSSALSARADLEVKLKDQIALRQAVLAVTSDIRKDPNEAGPLGPLEDRYAVSNNMLIRTGSQWADLQGSALALDIEDFDLKVIDGRAMIFIESVGGQQVETSIYLRVD